MRHLCGIDEAGRGPLAGPVTAAAVILSPGFPAHLLGDSKKISPRRREALAARIQHDALGWAIGWASHVEIDQMNILAATLRAMDRAFRSLDVIPSIVIVDGLHAPELPCPTETLVKADTLEPAVMAASILAKVARDRWMRSYAVRDSRYGFDRHMGYPTLFHREMVRRHGLSAIHRRTFRVSESGSSVS